MEITIKWLVIKLVVQFRMCACIEKWLRVEEGMQGIFFSIGKDSNLGVSGTQPFPSRLNSPNCDVIMDAIASLITASLAFTQPFVQGQIPENIKAPRHWPVNSAHKWPVTRKKCFHLMMSSCADGFSVMEFLRFPSLLLSKSIHMHT